jgi:hypothetical protein
MVKKNVGLMLCGAAVVLFGLLPRFVQDGVAEPPKEEAPKVAADEGPTLEKIRAAAFKKLLVLPGQIILTPRAAIGAAAADADSQNNQDTPFQRYLFYPYHDEELNTALKLHVNLISREAAFAFPKEVVPGLWRVDIRDYQWDRQTWENLAAIDPYFHRLSEQTVETEETYDQPYGQYDCYGKWFQTEVRRETRRSRKRVVKSVLFSPLAAGQLASLALATNSQAPIVRADWFLVQGARQLSLTNRQTGAGYYDWLGLKTLNDYLDLVGLNVKTSDRIEGVIRAVVSDSKVAGQNRQIVRRGAQSGGEWQTLEVEDQSGRGIAIQELRDGELIFVAQERYGANPCGLPVTVLANNLGVLQATVPDPIAGDRSPLNISNDTRVHVNLACMRCHLDHILQPFTEDVRATYTGRLQTIAGDKRVALELFRQYSSNVDRALAFDRNQFATAITTVTGLPVKESLTAYANAFNRYAYGRVTGTIFAAELGVPLPALEKALRDSAFRKGKGDFRTDPYLASVPGTLPRLNVEDAFSDTQDLLYGVIVQP